MLIGVITNYDSIAFNKRQVMGVLTCVVVHGYCFIFIGLCVCVCVCERERGGEGERERNSFRPWCIVVYQINIAIVNVSL